MNLTEQQQKWLVFAIGFIISFRNIPKAYAPPAPQAPPNQFFPHACPPGKKLYMGYGPTGGEYYICQTPPEVTLVPLSQSDCPEGSIYSPPSIHTTPTKPGECIKIENY